MLINLVPDFFAVLSAPDPLQAYQRYLDEHRSVLAAYWHNYVINLDSPHAEGVILRALAAQRRKRLLRDRGGEALDDVVAGVYLEDEAGLRAERIGRDTSYGRIIEAVERAEQIDIVRLHVADDSVRAGDDLSGAGDRRDGRERAGDEALANAT